MAKAPTPAQTAAPATTPGPAADPIRTLAERALALLAERKLTLATVESCTGGLVGAAITAVPGSSTSYVGGFITYANDAKTRLAGVNARMLRDYGAVSAQVARGMANGARNAARADIAVSVTGIAGPDGGSAEKPVGLVHFACATRDETHVLEKRFGDIGRDAVRAASTKAALELLIETIDSHE